MSHVESYEVATIKQLTLRGFDKDLEREITRLAEEEDISLNKAALRLLRIGAGLEDGARPHSKIGSSLDRYFGTWDEEDVQDFEQAQKDFERIDSELWS